jgi:acyl-CoA:acyl-CoA alkyltransferase
VHIESLAWEVPPHRVTSEALEDELAPTYQRLGIPKGCIETLVGIQARRFWDPGTAIDDIAARAATACLERTGRADAWRDKLGVIISTSVSKDFIEPSVAALVRGRLSLPPSCDAWDLGNACLGFLNGMDLAATLIESGRIEAALVVAGESSRRVVETTVARLNAPTSTMQDYKEALPTLTLGSGAVAMLLASPRHATTPHRLGGSVALGDPASSTICIGTPDWMKTDAQKLLTNGVALAGRTWRLAMEQLAWSDDVMAQYLCHQVGATHLATLGKELHLNLDKAFVTYPEHGNVGPAAIPLTLGLALEAGRVNDGDRLALMGIGSGLSCRMTEVVW